PTVSKPTVWRVLIRKIILGLVPDLRLPKATLRASIPATSPRPDLIPTSRHLQRLDNRKRKHLKIRAWACPPARRSPPPHPSMRPIQVTSQRTRTSHPMVPSPRWECPPLRRL